MKLTIELDVAVVYAEDVAGVLRRVATDVEHCAGELFDGDSRKHRGWTPERGAFSVTWRVEREKSHGSR